MGCKGISIDQVGGYPRDFRLKKEAKKGKNEKERFERTFTRVFEDGTTEGTWIGIDYIKKTPDGSYNIQGTSWNTAAKAAYKHYCDEARQDHLESMVIRDTGSYDFGSTWDSMPAAQRKKYTAEVRAMECGQETIRLREVTPGNNMSTFKYREKEFLVDNYVKNNRSRLSVKTIKPPKKQLKRDQHAEIIRNATYN